ncbi:MAG: signal recognition particle protein [Zetaproteobacteria bacterium]|nr:MAG: signal recognition particle protein [Zetaproteobacteria bacterium]
MFRNLTDKLGEIAHRLQGKARVDEATLDATLREMRLVLLEADVALPVVRHLIDGVRTRALGAKVARSLQPGQVVVKILHDHLAGVLGGDRRPLRLERIPSTILLCGLQGAGKTTTAGKLARLLAAEGKKVALTSVDATRPAAREQLQVLAGQIGVPYLVGGGEDPVAMARSACDQARVNGHHVLIVDTAGRQVVDTALMEEIAAVDAAIAPQERLLVLDAMTGQSALTVAERFHQRVPMSGCILTKADADVRGGAALSIAHVTGVPIRFLGTGEKLDAIEPFDGRRFAGRILGQGDIVGLVEKVQAEVDEQRARKIGDKLRKGKFDLADFGEQLDQMVNMGGMGALLKMLPGTKLPREALEQADDRQLRRMRAIIHSMTPKERQRPAIINGSRKRRIAAGSGTSVQQVNQLLKQFAQMQKMMKRMRGGRGKRMLAQLAGRMGLPGGFPGGLPDA